MNLFLSSFISGPPEGDSTATVAGENGQAGDNNNSHSDEEKGRDSGSVSGSEDNKSVTMPTLESLEPDTSVAASTNG